MAYNLIPSTFSDAGSSVKHMDNATAAEGLRLWNYLVNTYGMENPLAFDPTNKKQVKIARALQTEFTKAEIRKKLKITALKVDFGDGSRGNRGSGNQGNLFEQQLEAGINDWIETSELANNKYRDFIYGLVKHYHLEDCIAVRVIAEGGENKKRPMQLVNGHWKIGTASLATGYNIGATITDLTLESKCKNKPLHKYYLSLKTSGTTTLSNLGLKTSVFPVEQVKAGNITTTDGIALMKTFGLDEATFCATFNQFQSGNKNFKVLDASPNYNKPLLQELIKGSLGYGYHYVHMNKGKIKHMEITEQFLNKAANVTNVRISYGGETGGAKRVNIHMSTPLLDMTFNIRNTSDRGTTSDPDRVYPDKLQSGYKMKGESIETVFQD
tara:strand:+ start:1379 stop:2527 length:1149 start_codon:yes stop_codon:yes gene_type:complete